MLRARELTTQTPLCRVMSRMRLAMRNTVEAANSGINIEKIRHLKNNIVELKSNIKAKEKAVKRAQETIIECEARLLEMKDRKTKVQKRAEQDRERRHLVRENYADAKRRWRESKTSKEVEAANRKLKQAKKEHLLKERRRHIEKSFSRTRVILEEEIEKLEKKVKDQEITIKSCNEEIDSLNEKLAEAKIDVTHVTKELKDRKEKAVEEKAECLADVNKLENQNKTLQEMLADTTRKLVEAVAKENQTHLEILEIGHRMAADAQITEEMKQRDLMAKEAADTRARINELRERHKDALVGPINTGEAISIMLESQKRAQKALEAAKVKLEAHATEHAMQRDRIEKITEMFGKLALVTAKKREATMTHTREIAEAVIADAVAKMSDPNESMVEIGIVLEELFQTDPTVPESEIESTHMCNKSRFVTAQAKVNLLKQMLRQITETYNEHEKYCTANEVQKEVETRLRRIRTYIGDTPSANPLENEQTIFHRMSELQSIIDEEQRKILELTQAVEADKEGKQLLNQHEVKSLEKGISILRGFANTKVGDGFDVQVFRRAIEVLENHANSHKELERYQRFVSIALSLSSSVSFNLNCYKFLISGLQENKCLQESQDLVITLEEKERIEHVVNSAMKAFNIGERLEIKIGKAAVDLRDIIECWQEIISETVAAAGVILFNINVLKKRKIVFEKQAEERAKCRKCDDSSV